PIEITNPLVTPEILQAVKTMLTEHRIPYLSSETTAAANYLQIDPLLLAGEPQLPLFETVYPEVDLLDTKRLLQAANDILNFITWNSSPKLLWYLLKYLRVDEKKTELTQALLQATGTVDPETIRLLLTRVNPGEIPYIPDLPRNPLAKAFSFNRVDNVKVLLADARTT